MKKLLTAGLLAGLLSISASSLARALLQDTETSFGNPVSAASLNLRVGENDPSTFQFAMFNVLPGEEQEITVPVLNTGVVMGTFWLEVAVGDSTEGDNPEPETDITGDGELEECAELALVFDNQSGGAESLLQFTAVAQLVGQPVQANSLVDEWINEQHATMHLLLRTDACGPEAMGDQFTVDLTFHLDQV